MPTEIHTNGMTSLETLDQRNKIVKYQDLP
jgi:hypothetical protein